MNASASEKSLNVHVRSIALPARDQPGTSRRRAAISSSDRRARRATRSGRAMAGKRLAPPKLTLFKVDIEHPFGSKHGLSHDHDRGLRDDVEPKSNVQAHMEAKIGRASCRERVEIAVDAGALTKK